MDSNVINHQRAIAIQQIQASLQNLAPDIEYQVLGSADQAVKDLRFLQYIATALQSLEAPKKAKAKTKAEQDTA